MLKKQSQTLNIRCTSPPLPPPPRPPRQRPQQQQPQLCNDNRATAIPPCLLSPPPLEPFPPPLGAPSFLSAVTPPRRRRTMSSNLGQLSLRVTLQMVFSLHSTICLSHLPFLMRCEPRGPQWVRPCKKYEEIRDSLSERLFLWIYRMKNHHLSVCIPFYSRDWMLSSYPREGGLVVLILHRHILLPRKFD